MRYNFRKPATIRKQRLLLYVAALFAIVQVSANLHPDAPRTEKPKAGKAIGLKNRKLDDKIAAFKKGGVGKEVNNNYDIEVVIDYALSLIGTPHVMGGYSSSGVDCSGLVKLAHAEVDVYLPRSSHDQARYGTIILPREKLKRGDIVFFHSTYKKRNLITHTGIYLGNNKFVHTSSSRGVTISTLRDSGYYQDHYLFATRLAD
jgi:murein DD-endopeptidase / murein LD-carboxypeptidase